MNRPRVILLAAGQGSRFGELTRDTHPSLLPIGGEPLLARTVRQLQKQGLEEFTVVVGHQAQRIKTALAGFPGVAFVESPTYATDTSVRSLQLGLGRKAGPVLVLEADLAMDDPAAAEIAGAAKSGDSVWFTQGRFQPAQHGGIVRSKKDGEVTDLRYAPAYDESLSQYRKLLGVLAIGAKQRPRFQRLLREGAASSLSQYYLTPWAQHLSVLACSAFDLMHRRIARCHTPEAYRQACEMLAPAGASAPAAPLRPAEISRARRFLWLSPSLAAPGSGSPAAKRRRILRSPAAPLVSP